MTNQWYFQVGGEELGPISYRELVELVRVGVITESDWVRSFWKDSHQRADSVVGLFYQARQARPAQPQQAEMSAAIVERLIAVEAPVTAEIVEKPEWLQRLLELQASLQTTKGFTGGSHDASETDSLRAENEQAVPDHSLFTNGEALLEEPEAVEQEGAFCSRESFAQDTTPSVSSAWAATMDAALTEVDSRGSTATRQRKGVWNALGTTTSVIFGKASSREFLGHAFRTACMIGTATMVGVWVDQWSERESMRFPSRSSQQEDSPRHFPWIGKCSNSEYMLLVVNLMLISGAGGYGIAAFLESRAEA